MTAIAALIDDIGKIWIGGDSAASDNDTFSLTIRKDEKVFMNYNMLIGCTSSFRMISLLKYAFVPPGHPECMSPEAYMNTIFIEEVRRCFRDGGYIWTENGRESGGNFIVGYKGCLYEIFDDFQVAVPVDPYLACGCGHDLCLGSLYSTVGQPPEERLRMALSAAERFSAGVRSPFVIMSM